MDALTRDRTVPVTAATESGPGCGPRSSRTAPGPFREPPAPYGSADRQPSTRPQPGWPPTLLRVGVVDRDPDFAARLADAIDEEGGLLAIGIASGTDSALALAATGVEIMLVDCGLPDDAEAIVRALRAGRPSMTVVGLSTRLDRSARAAVLAAGAAGALDRSTDVEDLAMIVHEAFARPASAA